MVAYFLHASSSGGNRPAAGLRISGVEQHLRGTTTLAANTWTHLATTYNGTTYRFFVNGVEVASRALSGSVEITDSPLRFGGNGVWGEFFQGRLDEIRVYNRALSAGEIQNDMNTPVANTVP